MILILPHRLNSAQWRKFSAQNSEQIVIWYEAVVAHLKIFIRALYGHHGMFSEWPMYRSRFVIHLDVCRYSNRLSQYPQSCHLSHTFSIARFIYIASQHVINPWRQRDMERQLCGVCKDCRRHRGLIAYWAIRREQRGRSCTAVQLSCSKLQAGAHLQCEKKLIKDTTKWALSISCCNSMWWGFQANNTAKMFKKPNNLKETGSLITAFITLCHRTLYWAKWIQFISSDTISLGQI